MIDTGKESIEGRDAHDQVEVSHDKISIVYVDIESAIAKNNSCKTTRNEGRNKANRKQHCRIELQIPFPQGCDIVKCLNRRWNRNE